MLESHFIANGTSPGQIQAVVIKNQRCRDNSQQEKKISRGKREKFSQDNSRPPCSKQEQYNIAPLGSH